MEGDCDAKVSTHLLSLLCLLDCIVTNLLVFRHYDDFYFKETLGLFSIEKEDLIEWFNEHFRSSSYRRFSIGIRSCKMYG